MNTPTTPTSGAADLRTEVAMIDAAMVEMANITPPLKRSECARLIRAALAAGQAVVPPNAITASIMRDDGGEEPVFCLMAAYRSEKDAMDAFALIAAAPAQPAATPSGKTYEVLIHDLGVIARTTLHATVEGSRRSYERDAVRQAIGVIRASQGQAPAEPEGISREDWIEQAVRVYLIAGDTDEQAQECAAYLWGELDMDDLADPYDAAMSDIEERNMPRKETQ